MMGYSKLFVGGTSLAGDEVELEGTAEGGNHLEIPHHPSKCSPPGFNKLSGGRIGCFSSPVAQLSSLFHIPGVYSVHQALGWGRISFCLICKVIFSLHAWRIL